MEGRGRLRRRLNEMHSLTQISDRVQAAPRERLQEQEQTYKRQTFVNMSTKLLCGKVNHAHLHDYIRHVAVSVCLDVGIVRLLRHQRVLRGVFERVECDDNVEVDKLLDLNKYTNILEHGTAKAARRSQPAAAMQIYGPPYEAKGQGKAPLRALLAEVDAEIVKQLDLKSRIPQAQAF